jgi:hypothetical protein
MVKDYEEGGGCAFWSACEEPFQEGEFGNARDQVLRILEGECGVLDDVTSFETFNVQRGELVSGNIASVGVVDTEGRVEDLVVMRNSLVQVIKGVREDYRVQILEIIRARVDQMGPVFCGFMEGLEENLGERS